MEELERLLRAGWLSIERFVRFRIPSAADADDVLQEVFLAACQKFSQLKNRDAFQAWLISIARNKCSDYFRQKAARAEVPMDTLADGELPDNRYGVPAADAVWETLYRLSGADRQILRLYFWQNLPQAEIARRLNIPVGTVKSRLHHAKRRFKNSYPCRMEAVKGACSMKRLPEQMPAYKIEASGEAPFAVQWEELMGWFLVPRPGEKISWGMYDMPLRRCSHVYDMQVTGKARVHGIDGVELTAREAARPDKKEDAGRTFVAQLTDTHCRYLAVLRNEGGMRNYTTFLDGEAFMPVWGFGENNCGRETYQAAKGLIRREGAVITSADKSWLLDIVGRYAVTINGKSWDTVCLMSIDARGCGVISEQFLDRAGKTVLWRRYNRDDWALDRYKKRWSERLPENDRLTVNGITYVHWYDCITDYIL